MSPDREVGPTVDGRRNLPFYAWLGALTAFFLYVVTYDLANYGPVTGDEGWILSASYKLATTGILGSDLFAGFFNADQHYFIALPGQHLFQALFLRLFGPGVGPARWPTVISGIVLLWTVSILARRWYGLRVAALASVLLLFWQPALVGEGSVPLITLSRSLRYDLATVAWIWLAVLLCDSWLRRPTRARALAIGVASAGAILTQFFGTVALIVVALSVLTAGKKRPPPAAHIASWLVGLFSLVGPYVVYVGAHWQDALGQTEYLKGGRANFGAGALWSNLLREPQRYRPVLEQLDIAPGPWLLVIGICPALLHLAKRLRQTGQRGDRLLALALASTVVFLALGDSTKAPLYTLPLLPALCIALALLAARLLEWAKGPERRQGRAVRLALLSLLILTVLHGVHFYYRDWRAALSVTPYQEQGNGIDAAMEAGATVAGPERWWWPLRHRNYLSINNLAHQWMIRRDQGEPAVSLASVLAENEIRYVIFDSLIRASTEERTRVLRRHYLAFLEACTTLEEEWADESYGEIRVYAVEAACR